MLALLCKLALMDILLFARFSRLLTGEILLDAGDIEESSAVAFAFLLEGNGPDFAGLAQVEKNHVAKPITLRDLLLTSPFDVCSVVHLRRMVAHGKFRFWLLGALIEEPMRGLSHWQMGAFRACGKNGQKKTRPEIFEAKPTYACV